MSSTHPLRLAVLISGGGTTLVNLCEQISAGRLPAEIVQVVASRNCQGIDRAQARNIPAQVITRKSCPSPDVFSEEIFQLCRAQQVDLVVLAGFLAQVPIPADFENRVMNIHPSLIPAFCGQGMYGHHVHEAVIERGCKVSGCTVHFCDNDYDHGPIILQSIVPVLDADTADDLAARVFTAECETYPEAIRLFAQQRLQIQNRRVRILPEN
jgi:formyltetrahydrofolate-dependent phosphoribosylglycinamide formyltransferase